ncbi:beta-lactamase-like protein [Polychytrium aggregatum]|uniref:beta-lactamase-like protein n=1 Tax=Polychytrium aggregatum TaxID=110093 RepID=UPI0022FE4B51|nr:beta-lactamase-like protein [Polychytrium aggregatum]KAI9205526.1 beta-lactamase-like protein [Polychytrium aggregatum]
MAAFIKFTPLTGAQNEDPLCYLLEVDSAKILLDCGWSDRFEPDDLTSLKRLAKHIDAVLISHSDIAHMGAYPYAYGQLGLTCPAYATIPVHDMGQICLYDAFQSRSEVEEFKVFSLDEVDAAFENILPLRYSQPFALLGKCQGITITAYPAGRTIGGALWKIKKDTDEIVYAVDYNHIKERHLNPTVLHKNTEALSRPSVLITDAFNSLNILSSRKHRETALVDSLAHYTKLGANVLLPVDSCVRVLELAYTLDQNWFSSNVPLIFLSYQSVRVINMAKNMIEWMGDNVTNTFSQRRENYFEFNHLRTYSALKDVLAIPGPKVVLASLSGLETGLANELLQLWAEHPQNAIVLTDRGHPNSLARRLYTEWESRLVRMDGQPLPTAPVQPNVYIDLEVRKAIPLEGQALVQYHERERERLTREALEASKGQSSIDDDDSDDDDGDESGTKDTLSTQFDVYVKDPIRSGGFFKQNQAFAMFPVFDSRKIVDDYGEAIDPGHYMKGEFQFALAQAAEEAKRPSTRMEVDKRPVISKPPSEYVTSQIRLFLGCVLVFIDFEGRSDGNSIKNILSQVSPRKLIVVHGSEAATNDLVSSCMSDDNMTKDIFAPTVGECINISSSKNIYQIKLTDSLVSSLRVERLDDYELSFVTGVVRTGKNQAGGNDGDQDGQPEDSAAPSPDDSSVVPDLVAQTTQLPTLDVLPLEHQKVHRPLLVGDVKLSEFRKVLQAEGYQTEFVEGGVLRVVASGTANAAPQGALAVRKLGLGKLVLEGPLSPQYFKVRRLLYSQHAVL